MKSVSNVPEKVSNAQYKQQSAPRANHRAMKSMDFRDPSLKMKTAGKGGRNYQTKGTLESEKQREKEIVIQKKKKKR